MFIQEFYSNIHCIDTSVPQFAMRFRGTRIVVTLNLISEVLHVPRVVHPDYPSCNHLWTMSRDELISHFCETPSIWGSKLNTPRSGFAKGLGFLNMVMTFTLTPLSHYNFITKPCPRFLLSLLEDLSIDFSSHFITSILDVYLDTATRDKLIFPSSITRILQHFHIPIPLSPLFPTTGAVSVGFVLRLHHLRLCFLPLLPLSPLVVWPSMPLWSSFSGWRLTLVVVLTISLMRCVKWTPE